MTVGKVKAGIAADTAKFGLVYILCIIVIAAPVRSMHNDCNTSMDHNSIYHNNDLTHRSVNITVIAESFCLLNTCTVMIEELNLTLSVISSTGFRITATNSTNLFVIITNESDIKNCSSNTTGSGSLQQPNVWPLFSQIASFCVVIIFAVANITIHFIYKELRTVSGILIMILCAIISIISCVNIIDITLTFYHQISIQTEVRATIFCYFQLFNINIYEATKTGLLAHFAYVMYKSYRLLETQENKSLLWKYTLFIFVAPAVISIIIIAVDVTVSRNAFETIAGRPCFVFLDISALGEIPLSSIIYYVILFVWLIVQLSLLTIALVFYFLTTKQCCTTSTFKDIRVSVVLLASVDFNLFPILLFSFIRVSEDNGPIILITLLIITVIKQSTLFILFTSSSKVTCHCMKIIVSKSLTTSFSYT